VYTEFGHYNVPKNPQLVKRFGKPMDAVCTDGKFAADSFMRAQARKYGIPMV
jgi:hypothetical protein